MVVTAIEQLIEEVLQGKRGAWQEFSQVVESLLQDSLWYWFRSDTSASSADTDHSDDSDRSGTEDPETIKRRLIVSVKRQLRADNFRFLSTILHSCRKHADNPDRRIFLYWLGFLLRNAHGWPEARRRGAAN